MKDGWQYNTRKKIGIKEGIFFKALTYLLVIATSPAGVPFQFSEHAPKPIKIVREMLDVPEAMAAQSTTGGLQINKVYRGTKAFATTVGEEVCSIGGTVDTNKCLMLVSADTAYEAPGESYFIPTFDDSSNLLITRGLAHDDNTSTENVEWQVIEFAAGVTIYTGTTAISKSSTSKTVTLPTTNLTASRTLLIVNGRNVAKYYALGNQSKRTLVLSSDEAWEVRGRFADAAAYTSGTITFDRGTNTDNAAGQVAVTVSYQVIVFDDEVNVQYGTAQITAANTDSGNVTITSVDLTKSVLFFTSKAAPPSTRGYENNYGTRGAITGATTLVFYRSTAVASSVIDIAYYVLEFTNSASVRSGTATTTTTSATGTLTSGGVNVDTARTFSIASASSTDATASGLTDLLFRQTVTNSSTLTMTRQGTTTTNSTVPWFAAQLPAVKITQPNGGDTGWTVGSAKSINWNYAIGNATDDWKLQFSVNSGGAWADIVRQTLIGNHGEATKFHLRYFEIAPGGCSSFEKHRHEHVVVCVRGKGKVLTGKKIHTMAFMDTIYIAPDTPHQLKNPFKTPFGFFCIVNAKRDKPNLLT